MMCHMSRLPEKHLPGKHLADKKAAQSCSPSLQGILQRPDTWRASSRGNARDNARGNAISTGYQQLDQALHLGGWPAGALSELYVSDYGVGELSLLLPVLRHWSQQEQLIFLLNPPAIPYPLALRAAGIDPACIRHVRCRNAKQSQWAACEILAAGSAAGLLYWSDKQAPDYHQRRQMQLSASRGRCSAFFLSNKAIEASHSPAALRIALQASGKQLQLRIHKQRGGHAGQTLLLLRDPRLWQQLSLHALTPEPLLSKQGLNKRLGNPLQKTPEREQTRWH